MQNLPISPYARNCIGYQNPEVNGSGYLLGLALGVGKTQKILSNDDATMIDQINAFDRAEIEYTYLGQTNMITVSSFCGPQGQIWGLDVAVAPHLRDKILFQIDKTAVYSAEPLLQALNCLFGSVDKRRFPLLPGTHVPCATKNINCEGPHIIYAALGLGIAKDRVSSACLMMEDVGIIPKSTTNVDEYALRVKRKVAESVMEVGKNQRVAYKEIFVSMKHIQIKEKEIGCALVAAPYFALAKDAIPKEGIEKLATMTLSEWQSSVE